MLTCDGLASDADIAALASTAPQAVRVAFAAAATDSACTVGDHDDLAIVAASATDPFLQPAVRVHLEQLAAGHAIADVSHRELVGGTISVPGVDIAIDDSAELGSPALLVTLDDALRLIQSGHNATDDVDLVITTILITAAPGAANAGTVGAAVPEPWTACVIEESRLGLSGPVNAGGAAA